MRVRIVAVVAVFSLLLTAGIAAASSDGDGADPRVDTRFTFGYDPDTQLFFTGIQDIDSATLDCSLAGSLDATYGEGEDGTTAITELDSGENEVTFGPSNPEDDAEAPAEVPVGYASAIDECGISGVSVGDNGHINHGQFMSLFNHLVDMRGRGCLNRWLAHSDLGKGDQQVNHQDFETVEIIPGTTGTIDFATVLADCQHGNKGEEHPGNQHKPDKTSLETDDGSSSGRPNSPGKSDQAPGKNKDE
jgi:hypothetical protein